MRHLRRGALWLPESPNLSLDRGPCPRKTLEGGIDLPGPRFEGIFGYKLIGPGGKVKMQGEMRNLILDSGLEGIGGGITIGQMTTYCQVGTGSTAPAVGQSALIAPASALINRVTTGNDATGAGPANAYWYRRKVFLLIEGEGTGNLTEVGISAAGGAPYWSRQLFKDGGGVPTVIPKTVDDQLQITYEFRCYPPTVDTSGTVTISGTNYDWTARAALIGNAAWGIAGFLNILGSFQPAWKAYETDVLNTTLGVPAGFAVDADSYANSGYVGGTHQLDATSKWEPPSANFATGIGSITMWSFGGVNTFQLAFTSAKIPKDSVKRFTFVGRMTWGRYP